MIFDETDVKCTFLPNVIKKVGCFYYVVGVFRSSESCSPKLTVWWNGFYLMYVSAFVEELLKSSIYCHRPNTPLRLYVKLHSQVFSKALFIEYLIYYPIVELLILVWFKKNRIIYLILNLLYYYFITNFNVNNFCHFWLIFSEIPTLKR